MRIPIWLILCVLGLAIWTGVAPSPVLELTLGWSLFGTAVLYAMSGFWLRAARSTQSITHVLDDAARVNAARNAEPRRGLNGEVQ